MSKGICKKPGPRKLCACVVRLALYHHKKFIIRTIYILAHYSCHCTHRDHWLTTTPLTPAYTTICNTFSPNTFSQHSHALSYLQTPLGRPGHNPRHTPLSTPCPQNTWAVCLPGQLIAARTVQLLKYYEKSLDTH